jgi:hypothetical protein
MRPALGATGASSLTSRRAEVSPAWATRTWARAASIAAARGVGSAQRGLVGGARLVDVELRDRARLVGLRRGHPLELRALPVGVRPGGGEVFPRLRQRRLLLADLCLAGADLGACLLAARGPHRRIDLEQLRPSGHALPPLHGHGREGAGNR